jgi:hypothetical protein
VAKGEETVGESAARLFQPITPLDSPLILFHGSSFHIKRLSYSNHLLTCCPKSFDLQQGKEMDQQMNEWWTNFFFLYSFS